MSIYDDWLEAKRVETEAVEIRRAIEDKITAQLGLAPDAEGTTTRKEDGFIVKATCRLNRKIDGDMLQALAEANGLSEHLPHLFRWKPEIVMKEWKAAAPDITKPLQAAITTTAGRPSYTIEKGE